MTDNYRNVNVYRDSQPYSGRKIAIMMRIMLSDIVIGDGVALALSLTAVGLTLRGGPLIRSILLPNNCYADCPLIRTNTVRTLAYRPRLFTVV